MALEENWKDKYLMMHQHFAQYLMMHQHLLGKMI
jgi:hypothetical protein